MPLFTCQRCGHTTPFKANLKAHLVRQHPCAPTLADIPPADLLAALTSDNRRQPVSADPPTLHNFGYEDLSHLLENLEYMDGVANSYSVGCIRMIEDALCDPLHPEKQSVRLCNAKKQSLEVRVDGQWLEYTRVVFMPKLVTHVLKLMLQHVETNMYVVGEEEHTHKLRHWLSVHSSISGTSTTVPRTFTHMTISAYSVFVNAKRKSSR